MVRWATYAPFSGQGFDLGPLADGPTRILWTPNLAIHFGSGCTATDVWYDAAPLP